MNEKETGRLEAFSDGVFAVAITLLILNIQAPTTPDLLTDSALLDFFHRQWPTLIAFVTSFATIGIMWINHHRLFTHIKRTDNNLLVFNLLLLLVIIFIPFPTALLAQQYAAHPDMHYAAILYSGTNVLLAIAFNLLWQYASYKNRLLDPKADFHSVQAITRQYRFGPLLYLIVLAFSWLSASVSVILILLLAMFYALPGRPLRTVSEKVEMKDDEGEMTRHE